MKTPIKVLLVDDDEEDFILTREVLEDISQKKYALEWVSTYGEAKNAILHNTHDIYLIDYRLGAQDGLELIRESVEAGCTRPLILLTGQGDQAIDEKALQAGAADYLVKHSLNPFQLERSIRYCIAHARNLDEIRSLNTELENRVEQRTRDLAFALAQLEDTNRHLKKAEGEMLKALAKERELNTLKSKFVTIASHEFRTPLSTILSSASLIGRYEAPDDQEKRAKHVERIKSAVHNLTNILTDFLTLSKLEEGYTTVQASYFDIVQFAEELTEEISTIAKENQTIRYSHRGQSKEVWMDKQLLKNVLINLLSNAIKYSGPGQSIELMTEIRPHSFVVIVKDEGMGIPDSDKPHMFSQFYRAHNAANIQGTGMGLVIVKKYVELMQGDITFESTENQGTTFTVRIPQQPNLIAE
ncbi:MAG: ATP-binding protein [Bacteroidota bacterium]